jgi:carboxynorspermidine decarboxylase
MRPEDPPESSYRPAVPPSIDEPLGNDLIELGHLQDTLTVRGQQAADDSAGAWELFVHRLIGGSEIDLEVGRVRELSDTVSAGLVQDGLLASPASLWNYTTATVLRGVRVAPTKLFERWHTIGRSGDASGPGAFLTARVVQEPVFALRQDDGSIRAFLNVCPHRSAELLTGQGRLERGRLSCSYHGWCFDATGACVNVPGQLRGELGEAFSPSEWGLLELGCAETNGWIHVALDGGRAGPPPATYTGPMPAAQQVARLLHAVHPGYPGVRAPEVADVVRFHLRLGRTASGLERRLAHLPAGREDSPAPSLEATSRDEIGRAEVDCLRIELRQCLIDTGRDASPWKPLLARATDAARNGKSASTTQPLAGLESSPSNGAMPSLPTWVYGASALFPAEANRLIRSTWQFVAHQKELAEPWDFVRLDIVGESMCVMRRPDGTLTAGMVREPWSRPARESLAAMEANWDPIDLDLWQGLIFVRLASGGPPVADVWEHPGLLVPYRVAEMEPLRGTGWYDFDVEVDYKVLWENFLELYHFPIAHKSLSRIFRVLPDSDLMPMRREPSRHCTPAERSYFDSLLASAPHSMAREETLRRQADRYKQLDAPLHFTVFGSIPLIRRAPITLGLTVFPDHLQAMSFVPVGPRQCRVRIRSYGHPIDVGSARGRALEAARRSNIDVLQVELVEEDIFVNYLSEAGTASRLRARPGILAGVEVSVRDFQWSFVRQMAQAGEGGE